ncbi:MAG: ATP-binding protein [Desulfotignum sp.]
MMSLLVLCQTDEVHAAPGKDWSDGLERSGFDSFAECRPSDTAEGLDLLAQAPDTLHLDAGTMMSALVNILDNAVDACLEDKEKHRHRISLAIFEKDGSLVMEIQDDGCGMDVETKAKIFDLFFSHYYMLIGNQGYNCRSKPDIV